MNTKIMELFRQAGGTVIVGTDELRTYTDHFNPEKFAELIVRECVGICQDTDGEDNIDARSGRQDCAVEIREHFGVEEYLTKKTEN